MTHTDTFPFREDLQKVLELAELTRNGLVQSESAWTDDEPRYGALLDLAKVTTDWLISLRGERESLTESLGVN